MGFAAGAIIIGKDTVPELVPSAIPGFHGCFLTVELHGYAHKVKLHKDQQQIIAGHHHKSSSMKDTGQIVANKIIKTIMGILQERMVAMPYQDTVPGVAQPNHVDIVGESDYDAKARYNEKKREAMSAAMERNDFGAAAPSIVDCTARLIAGFCHAKKGMTFTDPPVEFDGTGAARAAATPPAGCTVCMTEVMSGDSDIPANLFGNRNFNILLPGTTSKTYRHFTREHKVKTVMGLMGLVPADFGADGLCWRTVEALHLTVACHGAHDYHWRQNATTKKWTNATGVGGVGLLAMFKEAGEKAKSSDDFRRAADFPAGTSTSAIALWVCRWFRSVVSTNYLERSGGYLKDPIVVERVLLGFVDQPVAADVGKTGAVPFHVRVQSVEPLVVNATDIEALKTYKYSGGCSDDAICYGKAATDPHRRWYSRLPCQFQSVLSVARGDAPGCSPKLLFAGAVHMVTENQSECDWGEDFDHDHNAINLCIEMIDRAQCVTMVMVATVTNDNIPDSSPAKNNSNVGMCMLRMKTVQSFGIQAHVKTRDMDKGSYIVMFVVEFSVDTGKILLSGGSGTNGVGISSPLCKCRSPFSWCRHIVSAIVSITRLRNDCYKTATSGDKYWAVNGADPADYNPGNRALPISDLTPNYAFLSDILDRQIEPDEVEELLG